MSLANMLKLGQVYLNDGTWHGTRIVSESWVKQASGKQIDTPYSNIWTCGYGYQFWMSPYEGGISCGWCVRSDYYGFAEAGFGCCDSMPGIW